MDQNSTVFFVWVYFVQGVQVVGSECTYHDKGRDILFKLLLQSFLLQLITLRLILYLFTKLQELFIKHSLYFIFCADNLLI